MFLRLMSIWLVLESRRWKPYKRSYKRVLTSKCLINWGRMDIREWLPTVSEPQWLHFIGFVYVVARFLMVNCSSWSAGNIFDNGVIHIKLCLQFQAASFYPFLSYACCHTVLVVPFMLLNGWAYFIVQGRELGGGLPLHFLQKLKTFKDSMD